MKKMYEKITSVTDLICVREMLEKSLKEQGELLHRLYFNPFDISSDKKTIMNNIRDIYLGLNNINIIMQKGATFQTKDFAPFLANALNLLGKKKEIIQQDIIIKRKRKKTYYKECFFIQDIDQTPNYIPTIYDYNDFFAFKNSPVSEGIIILDEDTTYPFDTEQNLKDMYQDYPELEDVFYQLIDLKLKKPELSDPERLQEVLNNIKLSQKQNKKESNN